MSRAVIYTIGHSNHAMTDFLRLLEACAVELLVDVRSAPYSKFSPHFSKDNLNFVLKSHGIGYRFAGEFLGGRPETPDLYRNGVVPRGNADYLSLVDYQAVAKTSRYRVGIDRLMTLAATRRVAIKCSEADPDRCHRHHLIAQTLIASDVEVLHILRDGSIAPAQPLVQQTSLLG
jgi:uncharacterized protein (DUF488 family)